MYSFTARATAVEELTDLETFVVALYDDPESPEYWIEIQKPLEVDDQDRELGMDTYCLSLADGRTHYGGITAIQIQGDRLSIEIDAQAARVLDEDGFVIFFDIPLDQVDAVEDGLVTVFEDEPSPPVITVNR
ncbi:MAG: hypothetical protein JOZ51_13230 [Chloroflexi bacterium]|nr:hypothetical protein [Chloroflexota bacterium]